jgi:predicted Zn-dependent protease
MSGTGLLETSPYAKESARRLRVNPVDPDALFFSAALLAAKGRFGGAIQLLDKLGKIYPEYPGLWRFKARLYREVGDAKKERLCLAAAERQDAARR